MRPGVTLFLFHRSHDVNCLELGQKLIETDALSFEFPSRLYSVAAADRLESLRDWEKGIAKLKSGDFAAWPYWDALHRASHVGCRSDYLMNDIVIFDQVAQASSSLTFELEISLESYTGSVES